MRKQENKNTAWRMRASENDKAHIAELAKRLKLKESEAVRRAVALALESTRPRDLRLSPRKTTPLHAAMTA